MACSNPLQAFCSREFPLLKSQARLSSGHVNVRSLILGCDFTRLDSKLQKQVEILISKPDCEYYFSFSQILFKIKLILFTFKIGDVGGKQTSTLFLRKDPAETLRRALVVT